jgi:ubiquinone/menaquinone biosynthesis C-methylase UbiE
MTAQPNFDRIARPYQALEYLTLGRWLERTRLHFLPELHSARNALLIGDGDGRFLAELLAANADLHATAIDRSAAMLHLLRKRCAPYLDRLHTREIDALDFFPDGNAQYDLVVSHFFLDCLTEEQVNEVVGRLAPALSSEALWLVSDFQIPTGALRVPAKVIVRALYLTFRILTGLQVTQLPDHAAIFMRAGFACIERRQFLGELLATELWQTVSQSKRR